MLFYLIRTTYNEYSAGYDYIATSLKEAESHIMEFADWYGNKGDCTIHVVDEHFKVLERREYEGGKLRRKSKGL